MALIYCDECKNLISDKVSICPHCGTPHVSHTIKITIEEKIILEFKTSFEPEKKVILTNQRMSWTEEIGLFGKKAYNIPLNQITAVTVESSIFGRIFGYGTLSICTASDSYMFRNVKSAYIIKEKISKAISMIR